METVKIYTQQITPRLIYTCNIIFKIVLKINYELVTEKSDKLTINYSADKLENALNIQPSGLLAKTGLSDHSVSPGNFEGLKTIFHHGNGDIPFDLFSAVFYMCSRYEEYLPFEADEHDRFKAEDSIAYRNDFIQEPVVEQWAILLATKLKIPITINVASAKLTVDVDDAWKYKNRSIIKNMGGLLKDAFTFNFKEVSQRLSVLLGINKDPWASYEYLDTLEEKLGEPHQYFFLMNKEKPYDSAIASRKKAFKALVQNKQLKRKVGIHPSYASNYSLKQLNKEFYGLSRIVKNKPMVSRQHYLKFEFPETFKKLIKLGIVEDHSLGWASQMGFRAGISRPFPFYDLLAEKETHLLFVPFIYMDRTLKDYMQLTPEKAIDSIKTVIDKIKAVGGQFTILWHNDSVSDHGEWEGWRNVLEESIDYCKSE